MGSIREFTFLAHGGASVEGEGHKYRPWGFLGGSDGFTAGLAVRTREGRTRKLPSKVPYTRARAGDTFVAVGPSGGGYGDPRERDPRRVLEDVRDGYFSSATARRDYGVVIRKDLTLDEAATARARAAGPAPRGRRGPGRTGAS
jgi:N-methylhydantoinase B